MADDPLLERVRSALSGRPVTERKMFGGTCFLLCGNMLVCASKRGLLVRVGKEGHAAAVAQPQASAMEMRGRPMPGYVFVAEGIEAEADLRQWLALALAYVETLPGRPSKSAGSRAKGVRR